LADVLTICLAKEVHGRGRPTHQEAGQKRAMLFQSNSVTETFDLEKQTLKLASTISKAQIL